MNENQNDFVVRPFPDSLPILPRRALDGHKGSYGTVLGIGGSRGMAGSVALAGYAALRAGAGLVRLAVPEPILETVAGYHPEPTTIPCPADRNGRFSLDARRNILDACNAATTIFFGPGLGRSAGLNRLVFRILRHLDKPVVLDADALNALSDQEGAARLFANDRPAILTPHPGEFARLNGSPAPSEENREQRLKAARRFADRWKVVLVLKGHETITTDGDRIAVNTTGNPGMATGGSGDVLTGVIAALAAQGLEPYDAARLGVFLHGLAGDFAAERLGQESVVASSIADRLPDAFKSLRK